MLRFWKYALYAFCGLSCFRRKTSTGEGEGFHTAFEEEKGKDANQNRHRGKL